MTLSEYQIRMEAYQLSKVEEDFRIAKQAWYNQIVQNVDGNGKPQFKSFNDFYDLQANIDAVRSTFEADYQAPKKKQKKRDILLERIKQFKKLHPREGGGK